MKLSRRKLDPIDIDYRSRCIIKSNDGFDVIRYGCSAKEYDGPDADNVHEFDEDYRDKRT